MTRCFSILFRKQRVAHIMTLRLDVRALFFFDYVISGYSQLVRDYRVNSRKAISYIRKKAFEI